MDKMISPNDDDIHIDDDDDFLVVNFYLLYREERLKLVIKSNTCHANEIILDTGLLDLFFITIMSY